MTKKEALALVEKYINGWGIVIVDSDNGIIRDSEFGAEPAEVDTIPHDEDHTTIVYRVEFIPVRTIQSRTTIQEFK